MIVIHKQPITRYILSPNFSEIVKSLTLSKMSSFSYTHSFNRVISSLKSSLNWNSTELNAIEIVHLFVGP